MMAIYLDENWAGRDAVIFYPNLQSCLSVTLALNGSADFVGTHLTTGTNEVEMQAIFAYMNQLAGNDTIGGIYCLGNLVEFREKPGSDSPVDGSLQGTLSLRYPLQLANTLGRIFHFNYPIKCFDTVRAVGGGVGSMARVRRVIQTVVECGFVKQGEYQQGPATIGVPDTIRCANRQNNQMRALRDFERHFTRTVQRPFIIIDPRKFVEI
jgi:hypothetical protein